MTIPLQFASFYERQEVYVWSNCLLDLGTDFLVGNIVFVMVIVNTVMGCHPVSSRLITIRLRAVPFNITIVQA